MKLITVQELKSKLDNNERIQLIDIREYYEVMNGNIGALHIPMGDFISRIDEIEKAIPVILQCKTGHRSENMAIYLTQRGYQNIYNLEGGLTAWAEQIDPSVIVY